jgi:hypothetical protein
VLVLGGEALSALGSGLTLAFFVVYLHQARGLSVGLAGLALACIAGAGLAANPFGGWLSDRAGPRDALAVGLILVAAGSFAVALARAPWQAFAAAVLVGAGTGIGLPVLDPLLAGVVAPSGGRARSVCATRRSTPALGWERCRPRPWWRAGAVAAVRAGRGLVPGLRATAVRIARARPHRGGCPRRLGRPARLSGDCPRPGLSSPVGADGAAGHGRLCASTTPRSHEAAPRGRCVPNASVTSADAHAPAPDEEHPRRQVPPLPAPCIGTTWAR